MLNDELIGAYLDGELDAEKRALVEHWLATDKGASRRLDRMRRADSMVRMALPRVATPENDPLAAMIMESGRVAAPHRQTWARNAAALAAACVLGVLFGRMTLDLSPAEGGPWLMNAAVSDLLDSMPSGQIGRVGETEIAVALSVRSESGEVCRHFTASSGDEAVDALACRGDGGWHVVAQAAGARADRTAYHTAGSATVIDAAIAQLGTVEALDASQEAAMMQAGWRASD